MSSDDPASLDSGGDLHADEDLEEAGKEHPAAPGSFAGALDTDDSGTNETPAASPEPDGDTGNNGNGKGCGFGRGKGKGKGDITPSEPD